MELRFKRVIGTPLTYNRIPAFSHNGVGKRRIDPCNFSLTSDLKPVMDNMDRNKK